ncbi:MAG: 16S rRNA (adenine(1518)-N(6)/adenine(1519)-N(6))-dimethyltransferase RsmA [Akkermansiaceae bacterium]
MNQTEIKSRLSGMGVIPSKKLGQNFLIDENVARWIVDQLEIKAGDTIVEVGPGTGALTEHAAKLADRLILVEFDARLAEDLKRRFEDNDKVEVHHFDGARFDVRTLFKYQPVKLLGNLPYSAGGAIIKNFMKAPSPISRAVLMLQKEFIDRIIAKPRTKEYGVLSLRMQSEWVSRPIKTIPPQAFFPRPLIDSTVMVCEPLSAVNDEPAPIYDARLFDEIVRRGFAQRRKQVKKQMPQIDDDSGRSWEQAAEIIGVPITARAEEIGLDQWIALSQYYDNHPLKDEAQNSDEVFDVVDMDDQVVRQEIREVVHRDNLIHRAVHMLVFNKRKEVFLQKRSRLKDMNSGVWGTSAAGHLNTGEGYEEAAVRELHEELGVQKTELQEIGRLLPDEKNGWEHIRIYLCRHDGAMRYPCSEIETGQWLPIELIQEWLEIRPQDFAEGFLSSWKVFYKLAQESGQPPESTLTN